MNPRPKWIWIGHGLTALWVGSVAIITGGDTNDPLFDAIFTVPLAGWVLVLIARRFLKGNENGADRP